MLRLLTDFLFPPFCVKCNRFGNYLCPNCFQHLQFYDQQLEIQIPAADFDELYSTVHYISPATELMKGLKYSSYWSLSETIGEMMKHFLPLKEKPDLLTFVPLHKKRQWNRGFNQAEHIASYLGKAWHVPIKNTLQRTKATTPQAELSRSKRLLHLRRAFAYHSSVNIEGKTIGLIDDVSTTGTTLNECAAVLKLHGAKKVIGIVFAHGK